jgi:uncharacterized protein (DUF3820 family)
MVRLTDEDPMPFGKHKGTALKKVPAKYLVWLYEQMLDDDNDKLRMFRYLQANEKVLRSEAGETEEEDDGS